jgi:multiple sugar transport system substrate-binding protein
MESLKLFDGNFAKGGAALTCAFSNLPKFLDNPGNKDSVVTGKIGCRPAGTLKASASAAPCCGSIFRPLSRRKPRILKRAYLFLQWVGSSRIYAWMTANPGGYFDPFRLSDFSDPLVRQTYHAYHMDIVRETVPRTVPSINYPDATAFHNALDENLVAACTKTKTPEAAMADTEREWKRIARLMGEDKLLEAIKTNKAAWPTVTDPVS